jgi:hypothetical protein
LEALLSKQGPADFQISGPGLNEMEAYPLKKSVVLFGTTLCNLHYRLCT